MSTTDHSNDEQKREKVEFYLQMFATLIGGGFLTWTLGSFFTAKADQQKQLDNFVNSLAKLVIENNLYASKVGTTASSPNAPIQGKASFAKLTVPENQQAASGETVVSDEGTSLVKPESFVAQAYVINTLQAFDGPFILKDNGKKEVVIKFLYGFQLLGHCDINITPSGKMPGKCFPSKIPLNLADLDSVDFNNVAKILSGINLSSVKLRNAMLRGIILPNAKFDDSQLQGSDLSNSDLTGATFRRAYLQNANFKRAIVDNVKFNDAMLCGADFSGAILKNSSFDGAFVDDKTILPSTISDNKNNKNKNKFDKLVKKPCFTP